MPVEVALPHVVVLLGGLPALEVAREECAHRVFRLHVHDGALVFGAGTGRVALQLFVDLQVFQVLHGHVAQGDGGVMLEKFLAVQPQFVDGLAEVGQFPVLRTFQPRQPPHQVQQHGAFGHLVGIGAEQRGVAGHIHLFQLLHDDGLAHGDGLRLHPRGVHVGLQGGQSEVVAADGSLDELFVRFHADVGEREEDAGGVAFEESCFLVETVAVRRGTEDVRGVGEGHATDGHAGKGHALGAFVLAVHMSLQAHRQVAVCVLCLGGQEGRQGTKQ